jgi:hypothetical protein
MPASIDDNYSKRGKGEGEVKKWREGGQVEGRENRE